MTDIASPCIRICIIDPDRGLCTGCHRSLEEIAAWGRITPAARAHVMGQLAARQRLLDPSG